VNVYALPGQDGVSLIDGGWRIEPAREVLADALRSLGATEADVRTCLVTHCHRDHYTMATLLRDEHGTEVGLGERERRNLEAVSAEAIGKPSAMIERLDVAGATEAADLLRAHAPGADELVGYEPPDQWLADGQRVKASGRELRVLATPGHTVGHVVFVDESAGLLFSGDHVLPHITPSVGFQPGPAPSPLADFLSSLAAVRAEPDRVMLPAHGAAGGSVHARVDELLEHHRVRLDDTLAALRSEPGTALGVARLLRWTRHGRGYGELDVFNQMLAVTETHAHLLVLEAQGRVTGAASAGGTRFTAR